jgi:hypothetical protein
MGEDKAREYLAEIAAAFQGKEREHFDLEKVLETVDSLKQEKVPELERVYLNSIRNRLMDLKTQQKLLGEIESDIEKTRQPGRAIKSVVNKAQNRIAAHGNRRQGELNILAQEHSLYGMADEQENEFLKAVFDMAKGRKVEGDFAIPAKKYLDIVEPDRLLLNAHGGDVSNVAPIIFNEPTDNLRMEGAEGMAKFKELWAADKFEAKDLEVLQAKIARSPEFMDVMAPHKERIGQEKKSIRDAASADIAAIKDGKSLHSTQHTTRKQAILDNNATELERIASAKEKLGSEADAKLNALAEEAAALKKAKTEATSKLRKKADAEKLATVKAQFEAKAAKIAEKRALLAASHSEAKARLADELTAVKQKADEEVLASRAIRDEGLAQAVKDKEAVLADLRKETAPTEAFAKLSPEERFAVLQESVYKIMTKQKSVFDSMPLSDSTYKSSGGMIMPKNLLKEIDNRNLIPFSNHEDYRAFMAEFGTQRGVVGLFTHTTRNARLTTTIREYGSKPLETLERLTSWFGKGKTSSALLSDLSYRDRKRLKDAMQSNDTKEVIIRRNAKGEIDYAKVVYSKRTGQPLEGVKLNELGEVIPESLPLRDPTSRNSLRYTPDEVRIESTAIYEPNLADRLLSITSGVAPQLMMDTPENLIRLSTGELFTQGNHPELAKTAMRMNSLVNATILNNNALSQATDAAIGGSAMSRLRRGGMSRGTITQFVHTAGSQMQYTHQLLFKNLLAKQGDLETIRNIDAVGILTDSFTSNVMTSGVLTSAYDMSIKDARDLGGLTKLDAGIARFTTAIDRMNHTTRINYAGRVTALESVYHFATDVVDKGHLTPGQMEMLTEYGLTPEDFSKSLVDIPGRNDIKRIDLNKLDADKQNMMGGFINERVQIATGMPDSRLQLIRSAGQDINTVPGFIAHILTNLMSYTINFGTRVLPDVVEGAGAGGVLAMFTGIGLLSITAKNAKRFVNGETFPDYGKHPEMLIRDVGSGMALPVLYGVDVVQNIIDAGIAIADGKTPNLDILDAGATISTIGDTALPLAKFIISCVAWGASEIPGYVAGTEDEFVNEERAAKFEKIVKELMYTTNVKALPAIVLLATKNPHIASMIYGMTSAWVGGPVRSIVQQEIKKNIDPERYARDAQRKYNRTGQRLFNDPLPPVDPYAQEDQ